jgi:hypothetical protein
MSGRERKKKVKVEVQDKTKQVNKGTQELLEY